MYRVMAGNRRSFILFQPLHETIFATMQEAERAIEEVRKDNWILYNDGDIISVHVCKVVGILKYRHDAYKGRQDLEEIRP